MALHHDAARAFDRDRGSHLYKSTQAKFFNKRSLCEFEKSIRDSGEHDTAMKNLGKLKSLMEHQVDIAQKMYHVTRCHHNLYTKVPLAIQQKSAEMLEKCRSELDSCCTEVVNSVQGAKEEMEKEKTNLQAQQADYRKKYKEQLNILDEQKRGRLTTLTRLRNTLVLCGGGANIDVAAGCMMGPKAASECTLTNWMTVRESKAWTFSTTHHTLWHSLPVLGLSVPWVPPILASGCFAGAWKLHKFVDQAKSNEQKDAEKNTEVWSDLAESVAGILKEINTNEELWQGISLHVQGVISKLELEQKHLDSSFSLSAWEGIRRTHVYLIVAVEKLLVWLDQADWIPLTFSLRSELNAENENWSEDDRYDQILNSMGKSFLESVELPQAGSLDGSALQHLPQQNLQFCLQAGAGSPPTCTKAQRQLSVLPQSSTLDAGSASQRPQYEAQLNGSQPQPVHQFQACGGPQGQTSIAPQQPQMQSQGQSLEEVPVSCSSPACFGSLQQSEEEPRASSCESGALVERFEPTFCVKPMTDEMGRPLHVIIVECPGRSFAQISMPMDCNGIHLTISKPAFASDSVLKWDHFFKFEDGPFALKEDGTKFEAGIFTVTLKKTTILAWDPQVITFQSENGHRPFCADPLPSHGSDDWEHLSQVGTSISRVSAPAATSQRHCLMRGSHVMTPNGHCLITELEEGGVLNCIMTD
jgi:hypothetical protein